MPASSSVMWPEPVSRCWKTRSGRWSKSLEGEHHLHPGWNLETCRMGSVGCRMCALQVRAYEGKEANSGNGETSRPSQPTTKPWLLQQGAPALYFFTKALTSSDRRWQFIEGYA